MGVWGTTDCNNFILASNCLYHVQSDSTGTLNMDDLTVGGTYFLVVDGFSNDICDFTVNVVSGSTNAPPVTGLPVINLSNYLYCSSGTLEATASEVPNAGYYNWTLNGSPIGNGSATLSYLLNPFLIGEFELCVTPGNQCEGDGPASCIIFSIEDGEIPPLTLFETICEGETYDFLGTPLTQAGVYIDTQTVNGCTQEVELFLEVASQDPSFIFEVICQGDSVVINDSLLTQAGSYEFLYPNAGANGCDSLLIVELEIIPPLMIALGDIEVCENELPYEVASGAVVSTAGPFEVYGTAQGFNCPDLYTGNLIVTPSNFTNLMETICAGDVYVLGGEVYAASGTYQEVLVAANGCDSVVVLALTVQPAIFTELAVFICEGEHYELGGEVYDASGTYQAVFTAANGCDSTVTLDLTVAPALSTELTETICEGEQYELGGQFYDASGTYQIALTAAAGCDSTVTLDLTVAPNISTVLIETICPGEQYELGGEAYDVSGTYQAVLTAANGCDSTVTLELTVTPAVSTELMETICAGETYELGGEVYGASGTYQVILIAENGCDSTVALNLEVLPALGLACPAGQQISLGVGCEWTVEDYTGLANAMGGCGGILIEQSPPAGTFISSPVDLTVTLSAKDENDDQANCSFVLSFVDDVLPVLPAAPADADYVCLSDVPAPSSLTATDNCSGEISALAVDSDNGGTGCAGDPLLITRTWVFEDGAGNASSISQSIRVEDEGTPPRLACLNGRVLLPDEADYALAIADVLDIANSSGGCGELTVTDISPLSLGCDDLGAPVEVMVTAADECGRENRCTAIIIVEPAEVEFPTAWARTSLGLGVGAAGFERCDNDGEFTLTTTAQQLPFDTDNYQYVHQEECGEITLTAQITQFTPNGWQGLFIRNGLGPADAGVAFRVRGETMARPANVVQVQSRQTDGGGLQVQQFTALSPPYWLRLVSAPAFQGGRWVQLQASADGENWDGVATATIAGLGDCVQLGLVVQSAQFGQRATARFANVKLTTGGLNNSLMGNTGPVAVGEDAIGAVDLWPNPADNRVHLAFEKPLEADLPYVLRNQLGQLAGQGQLKAGDTQVELDIADWPSGLYFLQLAPQQGLPAVLRFIKQ